MHRTSSFHSSSYLAAAGALLCVHCGSSSPHSSGASPNLIVNGDGEAAVGSTDGSPVNTPGWTSMGEATAIQYGAPSYPAATDPGPPNRGANFLAGGQDDATSSLTQSVDVSKYAASIDAGTVTYTLSGWLGGWQSQDDNTTVTITFDDAMGNVLGSSLIGPVVASDRNDVTKLEKSSGGSVPKNTRTVQVIVSMVRTDGAANDGYADDLSLVFAGI